MVHALLEAHRVLKLGGILIDLRPAAAHRRVGLGEGRRWQFLGALHEVFDDDYAADEAIDTVIRDGYFRSEKRRRFQVDRVLDTMQDVRDWLADFDLRRELPSHARLLDRLQRRLQRLPTPSKIVVRGPLKLGVLRRTETSAKRK